MSTKFLDFKVLTYSTVRLNDEVIPSVPGLLTCKNTQVPYRKPLPPDQLLNFSRLVSNTE